MRLGQQLRLLSKAIDNLNKKVSELTVQVEEIRMQIATQEKSEDLNQLIKEEAERLLNQKQLPGFGFHEPVYDYNPQLGDRVQFIISPLKYRNVIARLNKKDIDNKYYTDRQVEVKCPDGYEFDIHTYELLALCRLFNKEIPYYLRHLGQV